MINKVLWITNILFPEAFAKLRGESELRSSGGWMTSAADALLEFTEGRTKLFIATVFPLVKQLTKICGERITYYILPLNKDYHSCWKQIKDEIHPDIVHIHGTEYPYGLSYMEACGNENVVVSIQGLVSKIEPHYYDGISKRDYFRNITIGDIVRNRYRMPHSDLKKRSESERRTILTAKHIIGRTLWDKSNVWAINPKASYHCCNETLRSEFYEGKWDYQKCNKHTIFLSSMGSPIKGLPMFLKVLELVAREYPDVMVRIAGTDFTMKGKGVSGLYHYTWYGKFIMKLLYKANYKNRIIFAGNLNATQMKEEYLRSNVFVCPSSIENSSNSLSEAQILGVPTISSYVGGIPSLVEDSSCGYLYRFDDYEVLAYLICKVFKESQSFDNSQLIDCAQARHNKTNNSKCLLQIYENIVCLNV